MTTPTPRHAIDLAEIRRRWVDPLPCRRCGGPLSPAKKPNAEPTDPVVSWVCVRSGERDDEWYRHLARSKWIPHESSHVIRALADEVERLRVEVALAQAGGRPAKSAGIS